MASVWGGGFTLCGSVVRGSRLPWLPAPADACAKSFGRLQVPLPSGYLELAEFELPWPFAIAGCIALVVVGPFDSPSPTGYCPWHCFLDPDRDLNGRLFALYNGWR